MHDQPGRGQVFLVGAGPGDPKLVTVRAIECLRQADVVFYDYLANPQLLRYASAARLVCLGGHRSGRIWKQEDINAQLVREALDGHTVVRLKGGDPTIFGRGFEEAEYVARHDVSFEIVPGVTTALAASAYTGTPLTHRDSASAVAFITGQQKPDAPAGLDYRQLAVFPGTLVFYMGVTSSNRWSKDLIDAGKDPNTPVTMIRHASLPQQMTYRCHLHDVADVIRDQEIRPPVLTIVGEVANADGALDWAARRPLRGQTVLVTRTENQAADTITRLEQLGAQVLRQPAIAISAAEAAPLTNAINRISEFDWIVFSSSNGVRYFFERLFESGDIRQLGGCKIASIGPATDDTLKEFHLRSDLIPQRYVAEQLAEELSPLAENKRVLLVRASRGREILADELSKVAAVEQVVAYESHDVTEPDADIEEALQSGEIDWITVTSSAIAHSLFALFGNKLNQAKLASISPVTSQALRALDLEPAVEATAFNMQGVITAILEASDA